MAIGTVVGTGAVLGEVSDEHAGAGPEHGADGAADRPEHQAGGGESDPPLALPAVWSSVFERISVTYSAAWTAQTVTKARLRAERDVVSWFLQGTFVDGSPSVMPVL